MNECPHCNTHNPPQAVTCRVCNLNVPRSNPSPLTAGRALPKLAVFDLDNTLFDLSRRERAAKRQGLKPKGKGWYEFLNQNQYVLMDTAIPGTVPFIKSLSDGGYTIAYLSGRPSSILAATKQSLQESGFPIDATDRDLVFLHSGNQSSLANLTNHKKSVLTHLKSMFDVDYFFDDTPEFREAAKSLFIPGVYSSISSYTGKEERPSAPKKTRSSKARKNPDSARSEVDHDTWETYEEEGPSALTTSELNVIIPALQESNDILRARPASSAIDEVVQYQEEDIDELVDELKTRKPELMVNPPKPRKKRNKAGNMIKEPIKKYMSRFMGDSKMNKEFPANKQRFAVGLNYAREFYGDSIVDKHFPRKPMSNPRSNPSHEITISEILEQLEGVEEQLSDVEAEIAEARRDIENTDAGSSLEAVNYKMLDAWTEIQSNLQDTQASLKDMADWAAGSPEKHPDYQTNPRSNPHSPVTEAKEMYEQFHKKAPSSVKKQKVEIGDTWVGLGKAWSIGYRSGKETGNETQKYIHNFGVDEESGKKFKEPELYYVKNKDGSQMMVIMGGDWYIDVDADGEVSWIYV